MDKVLITGSNGFVGSNMSKLLAKYSINVRNISRKTVLNGKLIGDFKNINNWSDIITGTNIILHFSAYVHKKNKKKLNLNNEKDDIDTQITLKIANAAAKIGVKKFIFLSSVGVNGKNFLKAVNSKSKYNPYSNYTLSKKKF